MAGTAFSAANGFTRAFGPGDCGSATRVPTGVAPVLGALTA
jgi:hypothetical protein